MNDFGFDAHRRAQEVERLKKQENENVQAAKGVLTLCGFLGIMGYILYLMFFV